MTTDRHYNYGVARRMNLLATFFNCVYLIFTFVFDWVENLHHIMERWEAGQQTEESLILGGQLMGQSEIIPVINAH